MKCKFVAFLFVILAALPLHAQESDDFIGEVRVESAFARVLPDFEAQPSASVFDNERLEIVGRNLDGTWFEVRRIGRFNNLGWLYSGTMEWDFLPELLPLTDFTTGSIGSNPLMSAPPYAIFLNEPPNLRVQPSRRSPVVPNSIDVPPLVTVPIIARNQDGSWLFINYLGYQGWIIAYAGRPVPNVLEILAAPDLPPLENVPRVIIPPEVQQAQIDRLRTFINERRALAVGLEGFWWRVFRGEIMPCDAPPEVAYYPYGDADVQQLPELQRYTPRLREAIDYMTVSRTPFNACGIVEPDMVIDARDAAINARIIFDATLDALQNLEENVVQARR